MRPPLLRCWLSCVLFGGSIACADGSTGRADNAGSGRVHPVERYVASDMPPSFSTALDGANTTLPFRLGTQAIAASPTGGAGAESPIGRIARGALLASGDIVVLDNGAMVARLYGPDGTPNALNGKPGTGPGEFRRPMALTEAADGGLLISDADRVVQRYSPAGPGYRFLGDIRLPVDAEDMCRLGAHLVVHGLTAADPRLLRVYRDSGDQVGTFGEYYRSPSPLVNEVLGKGRILCDAPRELVVFAPNSAVSEARAFGADGTPVWRVLFLGSRADRIEETEGGYSWKFSTNGRHQLLSLVRLPDRGILIQWTFLTREEAVARASYGTILSFLLDPATGEPIGPDTTLPPILAATDSTVLIGYEDPEPRFEVRALLPRR